MEKEKIALKSLVNCYRCAYSMETDYESEEYDMQREIMQSAYDGIIALAGEEYAKKEGITPPEYDEE